MFEDDLFGSNTLARTPYPQLDIQGSLVETYFSPDDHTASHLVGLIDQAQQSVYFLAYSFTSDELGDAMLRRNQAGVTVAGVFEESQTYSNVGTEYDRLLDAGIDVRLDGNPRNMHHKVIIIDEAIVVMGSYNFSSNAEKLNDENTIILHDASSAGQFLAEFMRIFEDGHR
jgi:phosphatidylserine/phosphatidylglycerophosphate/cardiolipin synthase-like enzyme